MSDRGGSRRSPAAIGVGVIVGATETLFVISFAAVVFAGYLGSFRAEGIGLYLGATVVTLAGFAAVAGRRGGIGGVHAAVAAAFGVLVANVAVHTSGSVERGFQTAVAATLVVTVLCGLVFLGLGIRRLASLIRFVPYPVAGGFLAGAGWVLLKGGIYVAAGESPALAPLTELIHREQLIRWLPAAALALLLLLAVRLVKHPLAVPAVIAVGAVGFAIGMLATGSSIETAREGGWLLGPFELRWLWEPRTLRAMTEADWLAVLGQWASIGAAVLVSTVAIWVTVTETEVALRRDLDANRELRGAGVVNVVVGALGGIPAFHALVPTAIAERMHVDARTAGLVAAAVPLALIAFGVSVVELIPLMLVGGVLAFLGVALIVEWVWDRRRVLPPLERAVVIAIFAAVVAKGFLPGVLLGLVLAVVLFAISYGRIELVRELSFGDTYRSNVDRPAGERAELRALGDLVQILRVSGFVFFGSTSRLLERVRSRVERGGLRFLLIDLRRVTGVDSSAVVSFVKVLGLASAGGFEVVLTGASDRVRAQLERGGVREADGLLRFEPDLDRGLQRCEDALLGTAGEGALEGLDGVPPGLGPYLERVSLPEGTVLIRQDEPPGDVYVLASGRLGVQARTPEGTRMRLGTVRPGVVVGEVALYTGVPRMADVVAETPSVVLRLDAGSIERIGAEDPALASALHRWLATTLADRLHQTLETVDAVID